MIQTQWRSAKTLKAVILSCALFGFGCTNDPHSVTSRGSAPAGTAKTNSFIANAGPCSTEMIANAAATETGRIVDLERETLPKGLYLATVSELHLVKKLETGTTGRLIAREVSGSRAGEILCAENMDVFGDNFSLALLGPVKIETATEIASENLTVRQFYVFSDKNGHGLILSNPALDRRGQDLKTFLNTGASRGQVIRYSDRQYAIRLTREQDGARARLLIRLDLVKSN